MFCNSNIEVVSLLVNTILTKVLVQQHRVDSNMFFNTIFILIAGKLFYYKIYPMSFWGAG